MFIFIGNLIYPFPVAISFQHTYSYKLNLILISKNRCHNFFWLQQDLDLA